MLKKKLHKPVSTCGFIFCGTFGSTLTLSTEMIRSKIKEKVERMFQTPWQSKSKLLRPHHLICIL